jgi:hypothetical protein
MLWEALEVRQDPCSSVFGTQRTRRIDARLTISRFLGRYEAHHVRERRRYAEGEHNPHVRTDVGKALVEGAADPQPSLHRRHDVSLGAVGPSGDDPEEDDGHGLRDVESPRYVETSHGVVLCEDEEDGNQADRGQGEVGSDLVEGQPGESDARQRNQHGTHGKVIHDQLRTISMGGGVQNADIEASWG